MFEWDETKRRANLAKHGVDFADAIGIFAGPIFESEDARRDYGERCLRAIGSVGGEVLFVVYTPRRKFRRIISARKTNREETAAYHAHLRRLV
jgi:hypothetical protein